MPNNLPKTLIVTADVLPKRGGSAIVMENLISALPPDRICVLGELGLWDKPPARKEGSAKFYHFRSKLALFAGRGERFLSPIRWRLGNKLVNTICSIAEREGCRQIFAAYPDEFYCYSAYLAAKKLGLPFISYFHNTYADNTAMNGHRATTIQTQLFEYSRIVYVMSDGMKSFFESKYGLKNCVTLPHTFKAYPPPIASEATTSNSGVCRVVLFGNFNQSNIDATRRLVCALGTDPRFEVNLYSDVSSLLLRQRGLDTKNYKHQGSLSNANFIDMIQTLRSFDIVALTHGFSGSYGSIEYETIFPTRTIPMLLCGRPLLIHSPPNSFLTRFAMDHRIGEVVAIEDPNMIKVAANRLFGNVELAQGFVANALKASRMFHEPTVVSVLENGLKHSLEATN
jgi:hypothetical protein